MGHKGSHRSHDIGFIPRDSISWDKTISLSIKSWFTKIEYPFRKYADIPFEEPLRSEIRRFLISLDAYIESSNPVIPYRDILYGATNKDFATYLKNVKRKAFLTTWGAELFSVPDWWDDIPEYHINDIGDIFNYAYVIHWKNDDVDDIKASEEEVIFDPEMLNKFRFRLRDLLETVSGVEEVSPRTILSTITSSMSKAPDANERKPHYLIKPSHLKFADEIGVADRVILQVSPANERDSIIVNVEALNRISLIEQQTLLILEKLEGHIHLKDLDRISKRIHELGHNQHVFIQRDLKKEGLTKPRELLKIILEELKRAFVGFKAYEYPNFYDSLKIRHPNGDIIKYPRGHGLGMANALTTLMQLVVHEMTLDQTASIYPSADASKCLALNDDFTVAFDDTKVAEEYWDQEMVVMSGLSLLRANDKSFLSRHMYVIAERYILGADEYKKESYQRRELLLPLACFNVCHAKEYFSSVQLFVDFEYVNSYIAEMESYWGYEFHPDEFDYPYEVGGWINQKIYGVSMSLVLLDSNEYLPWVYRAYNACKTKVKKRSSKENYVSPMMKLYNMTDIEDRYRGIFDNSPMSIIHDKYGRIFKKSKKIFKSYWDKLLETRLKIFKKFEKGIPYEQLVSSIIDDNQNVQYFPISHMIESYEICDIYSGSVNDFYLDPNPIESYVALIKNANRDFKEEFSINFINEDAYSKRKTSTYSKDIERVLKSEHLSIFFIGKYSEFYIPKDDSNNHPEEQYLCPIRVSAVAAKMNYIGIPILKEKYWHPLIEKKRKVFNTLLSLNEQIVATRSGVSRSVLKALLTYCRNKGEKLEKTIQFLNDNFKEVEEKKDIARYDSDNDDQDPMKHLIEKVRDVPEDMIEISFPLLAINSGDLFWSWNSSPDDYVFTDKLSEQICKLLQTMIIHKTWGSSFDNALQQDILDLERDTVNVPFAVRFALAWGILEFLKSDPEVTELEDDATAFLWGDDDEY